MLGLIDHGELSEEGSRRSIVGTRQDTDLSKEQLLLQRAADDEKEAYAKTQY